MGRKTVKPGLELREKLIHLLNEKGTNNVTDLRDQESSTGLEKN